MKLRSGTTNESDEDANAISDGNKVTMGTIENVKVWWKLWWKLWLYKYELLAKINGWNEVDIYDGLPVYLKGDALKCCVGVMEQDADQYPTLSLLKNAMVENFHPFESEEMLLENLLNVRKEGMSVKDHTMKMGKILAKPAKVDMDYPSRQFYECSSPPKIKERVCTEKSKTLHSANFKLNFEKCNFIKREMPFLDHIKQLCLFNGLCSNFRYRTQKKKGKVFIIVN